MANINLVWLFVLFVVFVNIKNSLLKNPNYINRKLHSDILHLISIRQIILH